MARGVPANEIPPPSWYDIETAYGAQVVADARQVVLDRVGEKEAVAFGLGIRRFLAWLADGVQDTGDASGTLVATLKDDRPSDLSDAQYTQSMIAAVKNWQRSMETGGRFTGSTVRDYVTRATSTLEWLSPLCARRYPMFQARFVSMPKAEGTTATLGSMDWPELEGMKGAARERAALDLVRADALRRFDEYEAVFRFGQGLLSVQQEPDSARAIIRSVLIAERRCWAETGRSLFDPKSRMPTEIAEASSALYDPEVWDRVGAPGIVSRFVTVRGRLSQPTLANLMLACIGSTRQATMATMVVFCCDTGWNRQPMTDLPRSPIVFRADGEVGIASAAFISSFKNRAGHDVMAYLERRNTVSGLMEENVKAAWQATAKDADTEGDGDGHVLLRVGAGARQGASLLDVMDRYQGMADAIRPFDRERTFEDRFLLYLTHNHGLYSKNGITIGECFQDGVLGREGVMFRTLRKTYLTLQLREAGSVSAVRVAAGHTRTSVLMPHYLNSDDIKQELDESIRFFQNACQALAVRGRNDAGVALELSPDVLAWFERLAAISGIAPAACPDAGAPSAPEASHRLAFDPTPENLEDLFLTHLALRRWQSSANVARWRVQGLPLLAAVKAIGRTLCAKGLRPAYTRAARAACVKLRGGQVVLPPVMED